MSKYTLLELVQSVLSSMDGEEVNGINDTTESRQVVEIIKTVYNEMSSKMDWPEHYDFFELDASGDPAKPVIMYKPSDVKTISWVKYDCIRDDETASNYKYIDFVPLEDFVNMMLTQSTNDPLIDTFNITVGTASIPINYRTDRAPTTFTSPDDYTLIFDSYDSDVDSTLQKNKTICYGKKSVVWTESNSFVPDFDEDHFSLLLNEAKALAHYELRQMPHQKAELSARQQKIASQRNATGIPEYIAATDRLPNYGRKSGRGYYESPLHRSRQRGSW